VLDLRSARRGPLFDPDLGVAVDHGRPALERLLRHRPPMLLLDRITRVAPGRALVAERLLAHDDLGFRGHFPDHPLYPGALQVELMGQLGLCLQHFTDTTEVPDDASPPPVRLIRILDASFMSEARPGDLLTVLTEAIEDNGFTLRCAGQLLVGDRPVSACAFEALYG